MSAVDQLIPGLGAAESGLDLLGTIASLLDHLAERGLVKLKREPIEIVRRGETEIRKERDKGDMADQAKIASLYAQLTVDTKALNSYLQTALLKE